jgi:sensor histidine kinase regulating citrate/malate metabolism
METNQNQMTVRNVPRTNRQHGRKSVPATCRSIVEAQGGDIWVYDHPVKGTRFSVVLPSRRCARPLDEFPVSWQVARSRKQWTSPRSWE